MLGKALREELDNHRDEVVIATKGRAADDRRRPRPGFQPGRGFTADSRPSLGGAGGRPRGPLPGSLARSRTSLSRRPRQPFRSSWTRARSATSGSRTRASPRSMSSRGRGPWRPCSPPTTSSAATSKPTWLPRHGVSTDIGASCTGRFPARPAHRDHGRRHLLRGRRLAWWKPCSSRGDSFRRNLEVVAPAEALRRRRAGVALVAPAAVAWTLANRWPTSRSWVRGTRPTSRTPSRPPS